MSDEFLAILLLVATLGGGAYWVRVTRARR
jgi:hypothetical protein